MKMLTDCYCVNLYDIVEFPLLTEYNLTGKGITNGKKLCTLKVFECFAGNCDVTAFFSKVH